MKNHAERFIHEELERKKMAPPPIFSISCGPYKDHARAYLFWCKRKLVDNNTLFIVLV